MLCHWICPIPIFTARTGNPPEWHERVYLRNAIEFCMELHVIWSIQNDWKMKHTAHCSELWIATYGITLCQQNSRQSNLGPNGAGDTFIVHRHKNPRTVWVSWCLPLDRTEATHKPFVMISIRLPFRIPRSSDELVSRHCSESLSLSWSNGKNTHTVRYDFITITI